MKIRIIILHLSLLLIFNGLQAQILTPPVSKLPRINAAKVIGVRPNSPVLYKIAASGEKPLKYEVGGLPAGLKLDKQSGIISGKLSVRGDYKMQVKVTNSLGKAERSLTLKVGDEIALTPPMGWNSWNCWGKAVSKAKVLSSAQAMIDKGLIDHGWTYINIDDAWEGQRAADGSIQTNDSFPDMKGLGDWLHARGLKFGIYTSPGMKTCLGFIGSYNHELQDMTTYSAWGVDYVKSDWCSYGGIFDQEKDTSLAAYQKPYKKMYDALRAQNRDIYYSVCQYGMREVWKWGESVGANSWRTTGDIEDNWESVREIGFNQYLLHPYAKPGHWNDPDMLVVGNVGWGKLHPSRLTPDEQYSHVSLWSLLAAPLLIGCDIASMDDFTLSLLTNDEVLDINQDPLGKQAHRVYCNRSRYKFQMYAKELEDGSVALGIFNMMNYSLSYKDISLSQMGIPGGMVRDVWRQQDLGVFEDILKVKIPAHGVLLYKITKADNNKK
ncbi:MAG: putative Ig domain-containing protein [Paludibacter sp.]